LNSIKADVKTVAFFAISINNC